MPAKIKFIETIEILTIFLLVQNQEMLCEGNIIDTSKPVPLAENITICSKFLSQRLSDFCDNIIKVAKRDTSTSPLVDILMPRVAAIKRSRIKLSRRVRRQISDECCDRSCSIEHLISYCPPNSPIFNT